MKNNNFLGIISILTLIIATLGATFSFFRVAVKSDDSVVTMEAANFIMAVDVQPLYDRKNLIPLNDSDVMKAYNNECIDKNGNSACTAYTITVTNSGQDIDYVGNIKFTLRELVNLNYMVLNEDGTVYKDITNIISNTEQSLGEKFTLNSNSTRVFHIIVWLHNLDTVQDDDDALGSFNALVSYSSSAGSKITGTLTN